MPKAFNPISILGFVIGGLLLGHGFLSLLGIYSKDHVSVAILEGLYFIFGGLIGYLVGYSVILKVSQKKVVTVYKVKSLKYVPETRQIRERLSDDQIRISFEDLPQYRIEYDLTFGDQTGPTDVRYAEVIEEKTDGIALYVITWEYKFPLQQFLQDIWAPSYVFIVPKETVLTE